MGFGYPYIPGSTTPTPGNVVVRDANGNAFANNFTSAGATTAASGVTITLTAASARLQIITGSGGQVIKLPDATTLTVNSTFTFNNNQSAGNITVQDNAAGAVATVGPNGFLTVYCTGIGSAAGSWDSHASLPTNAAWDSNGINYTGSLVFKTLGTTALTINTSQVVSLANALPVASGGTNYTGGAWTTYTPSVTSGGGTLTTTSSAGAYILIGKWLIVRIGVTVTTNGTGSGSIIAGLPTGTSKANQIIMGRETSVTGKALTGTCSSGSGTVVILNYDNTYPAADGTTLYVNGVIELT